MGRTPKHPREPVFVKNEVHVRGLTRGTALAVAWIALTLLCACSSTKGPPLEAIDRKVDLERFMGDWYVVGSIPVTIPFFSEAGAHNAGARPRACRFR